MTTQPRICVLGAGPCGLAMAKHLLQVGLNNFVVFDRQRQPRGNWVEHDPSGHSSVYEGVHSISSRTLTSMQDLDFPPGTPDYPTRHQLHQYLQTYAITFGLTPYLRLGTEVTMVQPTAGCWHVTLSSGDTESFDHIVVANGHHSRPRVPELPPGFTGQVIHSHDFKTSYPFTGKRVLVLGGGNSAADIAVDLARRNGQATMSIRRGYRIIPRYLFGIPADLILRRFHRLPQAILRPAIHLLLRAARRGKASPMPKPDHPLFATHPLINSELAEALESGSVQIQGPIQSIEGNRIYFAGGSSQEFDIILAATGYDPSFPFLPFNHNDLPPTQPLYLRIVHPYHHGLFFLGLFQPSGSIWPLADLQARLVANHLAGRVTFPADLPEQAARDLKTAQKKYVASPRHRIEVDFYAYRRALLRSIPSSAASWNRPLP